MEKKKPKSKSAKRPKLTKAKQKELKAALNVYKDKHPVYVALETLEEQAWHLLGNERDVLCGERLPTNLDELAHYHHAPLTPRANRKAEEEWRKRFNEHHLRFFPEARGKVLNRRGALLKQVLWQAERVREGIKGGDPEAAALHSLRLMQWAARAGLALERGKGGKQKKKLMGIWYAVKQELTSHSDMTPKELWKHFKKNYQLGYGLDVDNREFSGEVEFDREQNLLFQTPAPKASRGRQTVITAKRTGITLKTFEEEYYREIKKLLKKPS